MFAICNPKIDQIRLQFARPGKQDVMRFNVSVEDTPAVHLFNGPNLHPVNTVHVRRGAAVLTNCRPRV